VSADTHYGIDAIPIDRPLPFAGVDPAALARPSAVLAEAVRAMVASFRRFAAQFGRWLRRWRAKLVVPKPSKVKRRARRRDIRRRYRKPRPTGYSVRAMRRRGELAGSY